MQWRGRRGSSNIEDRRRLGGGGARAGVGGVGALALLLVGWYFGVDLSPLLTGQDPQPGPSRDLTAEDQELAQFVSVTLADTEQVWTQIFATQIGRPYRPATLVLFRGATRSACGGATEAAGPFYCPLDQKVYLDTGFFATLRDRLGAGGDFAAAYVVAHEIGHHVQDELGLLGQTQQRQGQGADANALSVRVELMADCLAGVWANAAAAQLGTIEPGDVDEAMNAARQIGDDTLQRNSGQVPVPDSFTHGSSAERMAWFARGQGSGQVADCNTFQSPAP